VLGGGGGGVSCYKSSQNQKGGNNTSLEGEMGGFPMKGGSLFSKSKSWGVGGRGWHW